MVNEKQQQSTDQDTQATHSWGHVLANCLWGVTLLLVLAFFWQSIGEMLAR